MTEMSSSAILDPWALESRFILIPAMHSPFAMLPAPEPVGPERVKLDYLLNRPTRMSYLVEVPGHRLAYKAIGFDSVVYGDLDRLVPILGLAASAILFLAWCGGRVREAGPVEPPAEVPQRVDRQGDHADLGT